MWSRILVPLDGSNLAEQALDYAQEIASALGSEVILLNVCEPKQSQYHHMHQLYIEGVAKRLGEHLKEPSQVKALVLDGEPAEQIVNWTRKNKTSVIIMASHGRSGVMAWAMGSVASKVLGVSRVPVLLVRVGKKTTKVRRKHLLETVILPLDGSQAGEAAVPYVKELSQHLGVEVILIGVVTAGQHVHTVGGLDYILYPKAELELFKKEAGEYLRKVSRRFGRGKVQVELKVGDDVAGEIIRFAQKVKASLIAISAHGHSGIEKWVFGSVASKIVQSSPIPVLLVRATKIGA